MHAHRLQQQQAEPRASPLQTASSVYSQLCPAEQRLQSPVAQFTQHMGHAHETNSSGQLWPWGSASWVAGASNNPEACNRCSSSHGNLTLCKKN